MDDFREWLSDNLRYFMLGGGVLLIMLILIFSIRGCAGGSKKGDIDTPETVATTDSLTTNTDTQAGDDTSTAADSDSENPLTEASSEIKSLIETYYSALGSRDVEAIRAITVDLASEDEAKITNAQDYIEGYTVSNVYTKAGLTDSTYVVFAKFQYLCTGISTPVPALSQFYVITDTDGSLKINGAASSDASISAYISALQRDSDVQALTAEVQAENTAAQDSDPALKEFLESLGEADTSSSQSGSDEQAGTTYIATEAVNVRDSANSGDVIGGLEYGQEVQVLGFEGDWAIIDYDGQTAYVYAEYLSQVSES